MKIQSATCSTAAGDQKLVFLGLVKIAFLTAVPTTGVSLIYFYSIGSPLTVEAIITPWPLSRPETSTLFGFLDVLLFSPLIETALMFVPIWFCRKIRIGAHLIPLISAAIWAAVHMRGGHLIQIVQFWPFYWFTLVLLIHERRSPDFAWLVTSFVHAIHNALGIAIITGISLLQDSA